MRLHAKKPEDRIATAQEVEDLLARGLAAMQRPGNVPSLPEFAPAPSPIPLPPRRKGKGEGAAVGKNLREDETPGETVDIPKPAPALRPRFRTGRWAVAAAMLLLLLGGLGFTEATGVTNVRGTVIRLFSPEGTLVVEVDDPEVSVKRGRRWSPR